LSSHLLPVVELLVPRDEWRGARDVPLVRIYRWTGTAVVGDFGTGRWVAREQTPTP
jgi:hypothetical protein